VNQAILVQQDRLDLLALPVKLAHKGCREVLAVVVRLACEEKEVKSAHLDQPEAKAYLD